MRKEAIEKPVEKTMIYIHTYLYKIDCMLAIRFIPMIP